MSRLIVDIPDRLQPIPIIPFPPDELYPSPRLGVIPFVPAGITIAMLYTNDPSLDVFCGLSAGTVC
jgi:hypothetical protein